MNVARYSATTSANAFDDRGGEAGFTCAGGVGAAGSGSVAIVSGFGSDSCFALMRQIASELSRANLLTFRQGS
jgi:hypothetical protein